MFGDSAKAEIKFIFHDAANVGSAVKEEKTCSPLVELVNLGPGFSSVSLPKQISKSSYLIQVWIKTLIFSPDSSVELGICLFSPSLIIQMIKK